VIVALLSGLMACSDRQITSVEDPSPQASKVKGDPPVKVRAADASSADQGSSLDVTVVGSGFDDGTGTAQAFFEVEGDPDGIDVGTTTLVSDRKLVAAVSVATDARLGARDVRVITGSGETGMGVGIFEVTGSGGSDQPEYCATDLGTLGGKRGFSRARGLSGALGGGAYVIAGESAESVRDAPRAVRWRVEGSEVAGPHLLPVAGVYSASSAYSASGNGAFIAGWADMGSEERRWPALWEVSEAGELFIVLQPFGDASNGALALDVNDVGEAVGWSTTGWGLRVATVWTVSGDPTPLLSPLGSQTLPLTPELSGDSRARAINHEGYVVGEGWKPQAALPSEPVSHAILWRWRSNESPCDLDPGGERSGATGVTPNTIDGRLLVTGHKGTRAAVWDVDVSTCGILREWTFGDVGSYAIGVRRAGGGWQVSGGNESGGGYPVVWSWSEADGVRESVLATGGVGRGINEDGLVVGAVPVKGAEHAVLWRPTTE
jgi:hypothetical protein